MEQKHARKTKSKFFLILGSAGLLAVLAGFLKTFILPISAGNFKAPPIIFIHGFLATAWIVLFIVQSFLIQANNYKAHKKLGYFGLAIAVGTAITIVPAGLQQVNRELALNLGQTAISGIVGAMTTSLMFLFLVLAGIQLRNTTAAHKRLMALATIVLLWPAWFRFRHYFPSVSNPEIWFAVVLADSIIIIGIVWDKLVNKKVHWVFLYLGPLIIFEHILEVLLFDSNPWRMIANMIYNWIT